MYIRTWIITPVQIANSQNSPEWLAQGLSCKALFSDNLHAYTCMHISISTYTHILHSFVCTTRRTHALFTQAKTTHIHTCFERLADGRHASLCQSKLSHSTLIPLPCTEHAIHIMSFITCLFRHTCNTCMHVEAPTWNTLVGAASTCQSGYCKT